MGVYEYVHNIIFSGDFSKCYLSVSLSLTYLFFSYTLNIGAMKIGVLSDTHLTSVTEDFKKTLKKQFGDMDMIIHGGDMTSVAVHDYLSNWELRVVRGNMDDYELGAILPVKRVELIMGKKVGIIHGRGSPHNIEDVVFSEFKDVDIIIFGHSHVPANVRRGGVVMFNPGSYRGSYSHKGTVGMIEIDKGGEITFRHIEV